MAIEDDPTFPEWSQRLSDLNRIWDGYTNVKAEGHRGSVPEMQTALLHAIKLFRKASEAICA